MITGKPWLPITAVESLELHGYATLDAWCPDQTTANIAQQIGQVVDIERLLPGSGIPNVQSLRPRTQEQAPRNRYSGVFGRNAFPLHTDLAHWAVPPRYMMLRCLIGSSEVATQIVPYASLLSEVGRKTVSRAFVHLRRPRRGAAGLLRLEFLVEQFVGYRWDSIFLRPANNAAECVARATAISENHAAVSTITLVTAGDTLIVDNWRMLHGRTAVPAEAADRHLERVYLWELAS